MASTESQPSANQSFRERFRRLALVEFDPGQMLPAGVDRTHIARFFNAAEIADEIFWRQVSPQFDRASLVAQAGKDEELKEILLFNYGPYDRLGNDFPILPVEPKFKGSGFYPRGLTRERLKSYIQSHPAEKPVFESPFTVIRRVNSHLAAVPYHEVYKERVGSLSKVLDAVSQAEPHAAFRRYLSQRASDLLTDDYYQSDKLWVCLEDNPLDLVIGPYEVYDDQLMGLKASYKASVLWRDAEGSRATLRFKEQIGDLAIALKHQLGTLLKFECDRVKLSVANLIYAGGQARSTSPAIAFNLPNDERVIEEVGSRQVILRNVLEAKFHSVAWPIRMAMLQQPKADPAAAFSAFFEHTLFHEISHSLGPHRIIKDGHETTVNRSLSEYFSVLEEAKADVLAACFLLAQHDDASASTLVESYVGGLVRPIRFGLNSAHGGANCIQFNFLRRYGAISIDPKTQRIAANSHKLRAGIAKLASEILAIQANGDFEAAEQLVNEYRVMTSELETLLSMVKDLPIDIRIRYKSLN